MTERLSNIAQPRCAACGADVHRNQRVCAISVQPRLELLVRDSPYSELRFLVGRSSFRRSAVLPIACHDCETRLCAFLALRRPKASRPVPSNDSDVGSGTGWAVPVNEYCALLNMSYEPIVIPEDKSNVPLPEIKIVQRGLWQPTGPFLQLGSILLRL